MLGGAVIGGLGGGYAGHTILGDRLARKHTDAYQRDLDRMNRLTGKDRKAFVEKRLRDEDRRIQLDSLAAQRAAAVGLLMR